MTPELLVAMLGMATGALLAVVVIRLVQWLIPIRSKSHDT